MQRLGVVEVDDLYRVDAGVEQLLHVVRVDFLAGAVSFLRASPSPRYTALANTVPMRASLVAVLSSILIALVR